MMEEKQRRILGLWRPGADVIVAAPRTGPESQLATMINYYSDNLIIVISV